MRGRVPPTIRPIRHAVPYIQYHASWPRRHSYPLAAALEPHLQPTKPQPLPLRLAFGLPPHLTLRRVALPAPSGMHGHGGALVRHDDREQRDVGVRSDSQLTCPHCLGPYLDGWVVVAAQNGRV